MSIQRTKKSLIFVHAVVLLLAVKHLATANEDIDDEIAKALKIRASQHGISAEAEHRRILEQVLTRPRKSNFVSVLCRAPNVGMDSDFARIQNQPEADVFD